MPASSKMRRKVCPYGRTSLPRPSSAHIASMQLLLISTILMVIADGISAASQLKLLINDDELLLQPPQPVQVEALERHEGHEAADDPDERFNLYRSELKRLSYETIHRILRDENEPIYRREDAELRYYQKRFYQPTHEVVRRAAPVAQVREEIEQTPMLIKPAENTLKLTHAQLLNFDATRDYHGNRTIIQTLDLSNNQLQTVNLSAFTALQQVELANNSLTAIPLSANASSAITTLNLNGNQIAHAEAISNPNLRELHLSGNRITRLAHLNLSMLSALETLDLSCNRIAELETAFFPQRMHNLRHLNLAYNRLGTIYRETFYNLLSLNTLLLSHNNISDIDYETFLALPNLQYLDLSYNQLRGEAIRALQGIPDLVRLSIAYNPEVGAAMQEFVASWSLKELDASGTGLCQIPAALAQSVRTLKLTDNWLKIINCGDLDSYPLLQYLDLSHSRIEDIEDDALGRLEILETLFLDHNQLHKVPISLPTSLEHLFLQQNEIMDIQAQTFQGLNNLQTLDLSGNKLLYLPALPLPKLLTLNLRAAGLRGVSQAMVHTLPRLRDLLLDENPIKCSDLLSIAEWASPCRIVERSSGGNGYNNTELESFNIEGNSIMGDLGDEEQQRGDNRIGNGKSGGEQMIAMSAIADKLGQRQVPVQRVGDAALVNRESTEEELSLDIAKRIKLKQKFVRMHNFFEKFKSNCGMHGKAAAAEQTAEAVKPTCTIELDSSSSEQEERAELVAADPNTETRETTFNLPNEKRTQSEKSNIEMAKLSSMQQGDMDGKNMRSVVENNEDGVARRETKKEVEGIGAEIKLFKFNQKNFTAEMVGNTEPITPTKTTATTLAKLAAEATFDYKANATKAPATTFSRVSEKAKSAQPTGGPTGPAQGKAVAATTNRQMIKFTTIATPTKAPLAAKTLRQVATGSGAAATANSLRQQIRAATTVATKYAAAETTAPASTKSIVVTTKWPTTTTNRTKADAPKTMLANSTVHERLSATATTTTINSIVVSNREQRREEQIANETATTTRSINAKLAAKSSLNNTKEISAYQQQQQSTENAPDISQGNEATTAATTRTTTNADAATLLQITKYEAAKYASTAGAIGQLAQTISVAHKTDSNYYMTATTSTATQANSEILPIAATFFQIKRAQVQPSAEMATRVTNATFNVAATKLIGKSKTTRQEMTVSPEPAYPSEHAKGEGKTLKEAAAVKAKNVTTTIKESAQLSEATMQSHSLVQQRVDNNLTRNDSDNDGYKVQSNKQQQHPRAVEVAEAQGVTATAPAKQLAGPKATQFWQQHNFKRANPYPNDISGQRRQNGASHQWQQTEDEATSTTTTAEHTIDTTEAIVTTTTTTTTHAPPHKHEPLQLHIRNRHLIGTPLLMHRGQNMLVEAAEVLRLTTVTEKPTATTHHVTTTSTSKATNAILQNGTALAKSQATEAEHQKYSHPNAEMEAKVHLQFSTKSTNSNNFSNSERAEAEAIKVETNVTPEHRIGSDDHQRQNQHFDSRADKKMLAGNVVAATTTQIEVKTTAATATTTATDNINTEQHKATASEVSRMNNAERKALPRKHDEISAGGGGRHKPTLIMKKMTIQTKHAQHTPTTQQQQLQHYTLNTPRENESVLRGRSSEAVTGGAHALLGKISSAANVLLDNGSTHDVHAGTEHAERAHNMPKHKHSTVNTPIKSDSRDDLLTAMESEQFDEQVAQEKLDAPTAQHSISSPRREHTHAQEHEQERTVSRSQTQRWLDVRKVGPGTAHPGVVILLSFSLLAILLVGLMHVYRCDILPWRRHLLAHQQRPHHQRQFNAATDDDAHSFLHYHNNGGGEQQQQQQQQQQQWPQQPPRWHHGARALAPYSSPLHNLHVRELQKTSAVELEAAARVTRNYYDVRPYAKTAAATRRNGSTASSTSGETSRNSSSSLSSAHSSSTADDAFYVEMVAECGHLAGCGSANDALHCDMLPMELLAVASSSNRNDEKDADTAVHETVSRRLGGAEVDEADGAGAAIGAKAGKQATKAREYSGSSALMAGGYRSKMRSNSAAYVAPPTSSTRKFDLW
ncbi:uncharacterized protein LOC128855463 [Anastrepha ludens]|uniref:uncharacterized protein LOC128855463 n=1 Tax=Anastrepha ludens TaxID=28586 RepID=UPI0023AEE969|nr:uncharacterized protein LOC128855463 [Anastrepha ludens]